VISHWFTSLMMFVGSWLSGYLIIATDAWMQHPVGYVLQPLTVENAKALEHGLRVGVAW